MSRGVKETEQLVKSMQAQMKRLLTQLDDLEEMREDLEDDEYEEMRQDTMEQMVRQLAEALSLQKPSTEVRSSVMDAIRPTAYPFARCQAEFEASLKKMLSGDSSLVSELCEMQVDQTCHKLTARPPRRDGKKGREDVHTDCDCDQPAGCRCRAAAHSAQFAHHVWLVVRAMWRIAAEDPGDD